MSVTALGTGVPAYAFAPAAGVVRNFRSPIDVIDALELDLESTIAVVDSGGTTFLSPILGLLGGVVSRDGTLRSHLAIVSREFELPCVVGADLGEILDGTEVVLEVVDGDGILRLARDTGPPPAAPAPADVIPADSTNQDKVGAAPLERDDIPATLAPSGRSAGDVSAAWWDYVRRVGDEIAVKDFDVPVTPEALDALLAEELTDERLDDLVQHMGRAFKPEITRRSGFTSELFPMLPYMSLSVIDDFHTYADRVAVIDAAMPAEELARELRDAPGLASPLWIWMVGYHYLTGRECLIQLGKLRRDERLEDVRTVVDFWRRLALAHRGDGTLDNKDARFTNRYLPAPVVEDLVASGQTLDPAALKALKRLNATIAGYSFLYFCDSRVGVCDSGPYPRPDGRHTIVRDYLSLGPSAWGYPWAEQLTPPFAGITMALTFDPAAFSYFEINDWGTTFTEPDQLFTAVTDAAVVGHRTDGGTETLGPETWVGLATEISRNHLVLYQHFADLGREERIWSATRMYTSGLRPFAEVAGVLEKIDWSPHPDTLALYPDPLDDDARAGTVFGTAVVANDLPGSFSPIR